MVAAHRGRQAVLTVMSTFSTIPPITDGLSPVRDGTDHRIVEEKDASEEERQIKQVNAGIYLVDSEFLFSALEKSAPITGREKFTSPISLP